MRCAGVLPFSAALLALSLEGCGTDIAQTAVYGGVTAPPLLDCTPPETPPVLPTDPKLGGGDEVETWALAPLDAYGVDRGPGITLAARDGFRLFVNGHLLATSTESLVPTFIPLTLLPGDNAIAVVVTAVDGAPALLAQVDELERAYVTDDMLVGPNGNSVGWKVSASPGADFSLPTFDDSAWAAALDRGTPEQSPTCDPGLGFPAGSDAHFIAALDDGTAVFRLALRIEPIGFAEGTTGGGTTAPLFIGDPVAELEDALAGDDPKVVVLPEGSFDLRRSAADATESAACPVACPAGSSVTMTKNLLPDDQTCTVDTVMVQRREAKFDVGSNTTLVGMGRGTALRGLTLDVGASTNVIVRNLAMYDVNPELIEAGDGVSIDGADGVWIDHATFLWVSDGFIDSTTSSQNITVSWVPNEGANPYACFGRHPRSNELADTTATLHHTLWEHVAGRAPRTTRPLSQVHLFDNLVRDDVSYGVDAACQAQVLLEATTFEDVVAPTAKTTCTDSTEIGLIHAEGGGNVYGANVGPHSVNGSDAAEPADAVFSPPYAYVLDPADIARYVVDDRAGAGARWALPLSVP